MEISVNTISYAEGYGYSSSDLDYNINSSCPSCDKAGKQLSIVAGENTSSTECFVITQCYNCLSLKVSKFIREDDLEDYELTKSYPEEKFISKTISDSVTNKFPKFTEIYGQSELAEKYKLSEIAGMGYRKSLEFLVKQYVIDSSEIEKHEKIKRENLSNTISRLHDKRLQRLAKAISWIGNDNTHMFQQNPNYNIEDMKKFLKAFTNLIEIELLDDSLGELLQDTTE